MSAEVCQRHVGARFCSKISRKSVSLLVEGLAWLFCRIKSSSGIVSCSGDPDWRKTATARIRIENLWISAEVKVVDYLYTSFLQRKVP